MEIALLGFDFVSPNKGCEALSYSFVDMVRRLYPNENLVVHNFTYGNSLGEFPNVYKDIHFVNHKIMYRHPSFIFKTIMIMKKCDAVFDITYGDSFSDIYGLKWLKKTNMYKKIALFANKKFVLLPQTYGPFKDEKAKNNSFNIIKKAYKVYSRDGLSAEYVKKEIGRDVFVVSDLAFALPYDKNKYNLESDKIKVGINISSLLWEGGFTKDNQFGLTVDYQKYNKDIVSYLLDSGKYEVHLIGHVIEDVEGARENDLRALREIHKLYPDTIIAPAFKTPIEAKSYITNMDIFIGARMHATIGAISSNVATIPFSYSRKFEGLFGNLNYPYVVSAREISTEEAIENTKKWIEDYKTLQAKGIDSCKSSFEKLEKLENDIKSLIKG